MSLNHALDFPADHGGYVPYFYERGLHLSYPVSSQRARYRDAAPALQSYGPSFRDVGFGPDFGPQTVEDIVARGYFSVPPGDPVDAIITDRQHTSRLGLDDVISQIRQRYEIHDRILRQIESAKCAAMNAIYRHEAYCGPASANSKQQYAKHKAIQGLYEQQREEDVNLWNDVSRLRQSLPENAQLYLSAHRKVKALAAGGEALE